MKIIVSKSELEKMQEGFDNIVTQINEVDPEENIEKRPVVEYLAKLKDDMICKYRVFKGDFEISISEEMVTDFMGIYLNSVAKLLPVMKALEPAITMLVPVVGDMINDYRAFFVKYTGAIGEEVVEELELTTATTSVIPDYGNNKCNPF